jgi:hexulose-6-phosphate isomerase
LWIRNRYGKTESAFNRRNFLKGAATTAAALTAMPLTAAEEMKSTSTGLVLSPTGRKILLSCKLSMIAKEAEGRKLTIVERLTIAADAGFDGVDFDEAGNFTPQQARDAVSESGVFVYNAVNHAHWSERLTDPKAEVPAKTRANLEHCLGVSHAAGGSGVNCSSESGTCGIRFALTWRYMAVARPIWWKFERRGVRCARCLALASAAAASRRECR